MPKLDGTGPLGQGPRSGRGLGPCGQGQGFGQGQGLGRGMGCFGWGNCPYQFSGWRRLSDQEELAYLEDEEALLKEELIALQEEKKSLKQLVNKDSK